MRKLRPGQRYIPGFGLIRGGAATRRTRPQPQAPEHQPLVAQPEREALDDQTHADIEALWEKLGGRPLEQPGPLRLSSPRGEQRANFDAALEALKRPCAKCGHRFPPSNLNAGECPRCRAARDEQAMTNGGGPA